MPTMGWARDSAPGGAKDAAAPAPNVPPSAATGGWLGPGVAAGGAAGGGHGGRLAAGAGHDAVLGDGEAAVAVRRRPAHGGRALGGRGVDGAGGPGRGGRGAGAAQGLAQVDPAEAEVGVAPGGAEVVDGAVEQVA